VAVGSNLAAPGAQIIDGRDMIVLPGFVETHWHLWSTALRLVVRADDPKEGYFPTTIWVGRHCTPQDAAISVRLGVAEGLLSGITTVHDWSHNTVTPEHADAEIEALRAMGVRARFSSGLAAPWRAAAAEAEAPGRARDNRRREAAWARQDRLADAGQARRSHDDPGDRHQHGAGRRSLLRHRVPGQPANVDTVVVDGRILVRGGKLTAVDVAKTVREATESARAINDRAQRT
jgi:5-methylthioadenosine/S-adenosylhomocysteine deaminase